MIDHEPDERAKDYFKWRAALFAGLGTGVLFLFLSRGIPWGSMGFGMSMMGRELRFGNFASSLFLNSIVHIALSVVYAFVVGSIVYRADLIPAIVMGAAAGLGLYGLNFLFFHFALGFESVNETAPLVTHLFFGIFVAAAYKAFSVPRTDKVESHA